MPTTTKTTKTNNWLLEARKAHPALLAPLDLPRRYASARLADIPHTALVKVARDYGQQFWEVAPNGIAPMLIGGAGEYKTFTAAAIALAVRNEALVNVGWCNCASEFVRFDRLAFDPDTTHRIDFLKTVPFLIMDDFTQVPNGTRMMQTMVEIGSVRYDNMLPTLWTGNIILTKATLGRLIDTVGACLARRMLDGSEGFRVVVRGTRDHG